VTEAQVKERSRGRSCRLGPKPKALWPCGTCRPDDGGFVCSSSLCLLKPRFRYPTTLFLWYILSCVTVQTRNLASDTQPPCGLLFAQKRTRRPCPRHPGLWIFFPRTHCLPARTCNDLRRKQLPWPRGRRRPGAGEETAGVRRGDQQHRTLYMHSPYSSAWRMNWMAGV